jgi:hypothetical protein
MTSGFDGFARRLQAQLDQRMEEMTTNAVDLILLEAAWEDVIRCESEHTSLGNEVCTVDVTHIIISGHRRTRVCVSHATFKERQIRAGVECAECRKPAADCWKVVPI